MTVSFDEVGAAALALAPTLLPQWMDGGERRGHEWVGPRKSNGGIGDSWSVNLNTGAWANFSGSERGGDMVSLYAALNHINNGAALKKVASLVGVTEGRQAPKLPHVKPPERAPEPIPDDAYDPEPHPTLGIASACYRYGRAFAITRYDRPGGKVFSQWTWRRGKWINQGHASPRPAYHVELLIKHPEAPVLIVEGEKCADIAAHTLRKYVCMTWAGGANSVKGTDWNPLAGRDVIIWPDADDPGCLAGAQLATILARIASRVRVVQPNGQPPGWDIADAVAEGMDAKQIAKWAGDHIKVTVDSKEPTPPAAVRPRSEPSVVAMTEGSGAATAEPATEFLPAKERQHSKNYPDGQAPHSAMVSWQSLPLEKNDKGIPHATLSNASLILQHHQQYKGKVWLDSFRGKIYHTMRGTPRPWIDSDDRRATAYMQQQLKLPKLNLMTVHEAVMHAAECNEINSLTDWLDSLEWDETERLEHWLADYLGCERNAYNNAVAQNWPISMVARAYVPGCQVDTMPVLEGRMGRGKSTFLKVLAQPWYASIQIAFGEKDFFQAIQGKWLIEVPDMSGFSRREHSNILATITTREDVYRKSHGRITEEHPRVTVFAATSENSEYLQESRGRRRYWPLVCGEINIDGLRTQRDQIFAEAVVKYREGSTWHEMPDETDDEQLARASQDVWTGLVLRYADSYGDNKLKTETILENAVNLTADRWDEGHKRRVYRIMTENGWKQLHGRKERYWKKVTEEPK